MRASFHLAVIPLRYRGAVFDTDVLEGGGGVGVSDGDELQADGPPPEGSGAGRCLCRSSSLHRCGWDGGDRGARVGCTT